MTLSLRNFSALSFDCYGTLINWESGIYEQLEPLLSRLPRDHPLQNQDKVIARFNEIQGGLEREQPKLLYSDVLSKCLSTLAQEGGVELSEHEVQSFGRSVGEWPAFADTVDGLLRLKKRYKLIILSNVDHYNIQRTLSGPLAAVEFDAVLTAQDVGSYKPDHNNFHALLNTLDERFEIGKSDLLHVAKSLPVDHVPAKELGLTSAWIARGKDGVSAMGGNLKDLSDRVAFQWRFGSIGEMANEVEGEFAE